jgi:sulfate permease, SulP family
MVGVLLLIARLLKVGGLVDNISGAVLTGVKTAVGLTAGLLSAVLVGVVGTLFVVLRDLDRPDITELRMVGGRLRPAAAGTEPVSGLLILRLGAALYTANIRVAQQAITAAAAETPPAPRVLVLDLTVQGALSVTVLDGLRELAKNLADRGTTLWIAGLPARALATAQRTRWWSTWERAGRVWPTADDAADAYR